MRTGEIIVQSEGVDKATLTTDNNGKLLKDGGAVGVTSETGEWAASQTFTEQALAYGATVAWDLETQQAAKLTLTGNALLGNPTGKVNGMNCQLVVVQDAIGGHVLVLDTDYVLLAEDTTADPNAVAIYTFRVSGDLLYGSAVGN